jgi:hypothetical protein
MFWPSVVNDPRNHTNEHEQEVNARNATYEPGAESKMGNEK